MVSVFTTTRLHAEVGPSFGVSLPQSGSVLGGSDPVEQYETLTRFAQEAEESGFESAWLVDHFQQAPDRPREAMFECWTAMAALARDTRTIALGQWVLCNSYRPPSLLAKMTSCLDVISHGRLVVGIGAGSNDAEHSAYGYDFPTTRVRVEQLEEAAQILKLMWTQDQPVFHGNHYHIDGPFNDPQPVQKPHPPLLIGGSGERYTLRVVAKYADIYSGRAADTSPDEIRAKLAVLRRHCDAVGRNYDSIVKLQALGISLGGRPNHERTPGPRFRPNPVETLSGSDEEIARQIADRVLAGIQHVIISARRAQPGTYRHIAERVLPTVREMVAASKSQREPV